MSDIPSAVVAPAPVVQESTPIAEVTATSSTAAAANADDNANTDAPATNITSNGAGEHMMKRKVCIYFGYVGERYSGLQFVKEEHINTVERELLAGIHKAGFINDANFDCSHPMQKIGWERASRTDKGVHALKNLISVKLQFPDAVVKSGDFTGCVAKLNSLLPKDIRVYKIQPVTGSFNAYMMCIGRRYQYYLPTFALCSKAEYDAMLDHSLAPQHIVDEDIIAEPEPAEGEGGDDGSDPNNSSKVGEKRPREPRPNAKANKDIKYGAEPMNVFKTIPEAAMKQLASYRINKENLERARSLFQLYVGTKPYHNFTPGGKAADASTMRYIQRITVNEPEVLMPALHEGDEDAAKLAHLQARYPAGLEWVRIEIEGQSFMLNQIRKMIGNVICTMILGLPDYFVADALQCNVVRGIPMAPANGLFLSYLDFRLYNKRLEKMKEQPGIEVGKKMEVDMDFEERAAVKEAGMGDEEFATLCAERKATKEEVTAMHKQILATVGRRECVEDITGRWLRSARHVSRLCFRMEFGPSDDPMRYEKAPAPMASRTNPVKNFRAEQALAAIAEANYSAEAPAAADAAAVAVAPAAEVVAPVAEATATPAADEAASAPTA